MSRIISKIAIFLFIFVTGSFRTMASSEYPEVLFGNSVLPGFYGHSLVAYSGFSWVENVRGHLPVSDSLFFTPNNALSIKYTSSVQGAWEASVYFPESNPYHLISNQLMLSMFVYLPGGFDRDAMPGLTLMQGDSCTNTLLLHAYLPKLPDSLLFEHWVRLQIPLPDLGGLDPQVPIKGVRFLQGRPTGIDIINHLLIDQIEFVPRTPPETELGYPAVLQRVVAGAQHVDIEWQLPLDPGIRYAKVYRSIDGDHFEPVALRPISTSRFVDFVPEKNQAYQYKISWVDYLYHESPVSEVMEAKIQPVSDHQLLESIQSAHIHYFEQHTEFNSGMHRVHAVGEDATIDVEASGYGLLVQTVAVSDGWMTPGLYIRRLGTMIDFLCNQAQHYRGMFPAFLDGRTGQGVYADSLSFVSVRATASIAQGLLVVREYLRKLADEGDDGDSSARETTKLLAGIDQLWERIEWDAFAQEDTTVLFDHWSPEAAFEYARPMGGFGGDLLPYLLALASPTHPLSPNAYENGIGIGRVRHAEAASLDELSGEVGTVVDGVSIPLSESHALVYDQRPFRVDTLVYGFFLDVGDIDRSLLEAYRSFVAFDPRGKRDRFADYGKSLHRLTEAYRRRDNEMNAGNSYADIWGTKQRVVDAENGGEAYLTPVILPSIALSSIAFAPETGLRSTRSIYHNLGNALFTENGFRDWINIHEHRVAVDWNPFHQAMVPIMIENYQTGLLWRLFMNHPDISRMTQRYFQSTDETRN